MAETTEKMVRVRGKKPSFIGRYREAGEEFEVPESQVSKRWMEVLDGKPAKPEEPAKGLGDMDVDELLIEARKRGLNVPGNIRQDTLLAKIREHDAGGSPSDQAVI